ncbi:cyclic lactone autoinducer peptide [Iocasia frigidifontis]|uniref:Cyclic lactone autoinducer peptide n=1 Tax=Iocasia fonsfrigidae TaxID=2682810 RepID=A0A8A7KCA1_9FIRM|nr:cyclic lactone autoinducer peptide [Iocasia fonsfrigidae]QTL97009.1 cyclic lactone autoinducer peptide [Iocasia fonsfrigidae]
MLNLLKKIIMGVSKFNSNSNCDGLFFQPRKSE